MNNREIVSALKDAVTLFEDGDTDNAIETLEELIEDLLGEEVED